MNEPVLGLDDLAERVERATAGLVDLVRRDGQVHLDVVVTDHDGALKGSRYDVSVIGQLSEAVLQFLKVCFREARGGDVRVHVFLLCVCAGRGFSPSVLVA